MDDLFSILIYEKDRNLNSIFSEQFSYNKTYKLILINDKEIFFKTIKEKKCHIYIINLDTLVEEAQSFIDVFNIKNHYKNTIFLHSNLDNDFLIKHKNNFTFIKKPFKIYFLLEHIKKILSNPNSKNLNIFLMKNLVFIPNEKIIMNLDTNNKERLTEKETQILELLHKNQNYEILKKNLLTALWGINENINTHTLETHIYRLRQKLNKLEPNLAFSLNNINGKYIFQNHSIKQKG